VAAVVAELVPVFFVGGPATGRARGIEHDCGLFGADDSFGGDDVPDVFRDDVGCQEVEVSALVGEAAGGVDVAAVAAFGAAAGGGFNLDADEVAVGFYDRVVAGGISPGVENLETVFGGGGDELQFGPLPAAFAILDRVLEFHKPNKKRGLERPRLFLFRFWMLSH
jgi:hypothetical protein